MLSLIKQQSGVFGAWKFLTLAANEAADTMCLPVGPLLVPVSVWHARRRELIEREYAHGWPLGVWLAAGEAPKSIAGDLDDFSIIAVHFPSATDGRGCFAARLLRKRYAYRGELHAFGELSREHLLSLRYSGFDAFSLRPDRFDAAASGTPHAAVAGGLAQVAQALRLAACDLVRLDTARAA